MVVPSVITGTPCYVLDPSRGADCFRWKPQLVEITRFSGEGSDRSSLFYRFMGLFLGNDLWTSLITMRIVNVVISGLLLAAAFLVAKPERSRALALSIIAVMFPVSIFHVASSNPTSWAIAGLSVFWLFLLEAWSGSRRSWQARTGLLFLAALSAAIAAIGRGDSLVYLGVSAIAVAILRWRWLSRHWVWGVPVLVVVGIAALSGLPRTRSGLSVATASLPDAHALLFEWWPRFHVFEWPLLVSYVVGGATPRYLPYPIGYTMGLGWDSRAGFPIEFPSIVGILGVAVLALVVGVGLTRYSWPKIIAASLLFAAIFLISFLWVVGSGSAGWSQARYFVAPLLVLVAIVSLGQGRTPYLRKAVAALIWLGASVAAAAGLMTVVRRTTNGQPLVPDLAWNVYEAYPQWWWPDIGVPLAISPNYLIVVGALASSALFALMLVAIRHEPLSRERRP